LTTLYSFNKKDGDALEAGLLLLPDSPHREHHRVARRRFSKKSRPFAGWDWRLARRGNCASSSRRGADYRFEILAARSVKDMPKACTFWMVMRKI
jgi:hypothetical protein